ncbi:hypothetical protein PLESTF_000890600 [Pleodorina starrii]|nr:hypothetical protein PLESTF_000890600 [Pleodorina starrii]
MEVVDDEPSASHDEFFYLKEFAKSKFDPDKFISVFGSQSTRSQGGLAWLDGLLSDPRGRKLIYELSAAHRNSLLLNFAIQKIMKMGYQDEVAAAGSGLASYFSVFHKLLENKVAALLAVVRRAAEAEAEAAQVAGGEGSAAAAAASSSASGATAAAAAAAALAAARTQAQRDVAAIVKELRDSCEQSQHTYLHVQHILHHLGSQRGGEVLLAVAQQLEAEVAAAGPSLPVWSVQKLYAPPGSSPTQLEACNLIGRLLQAGPDGAVSSDVLRLYGLYSSETAAAASSSAGGGGGGGELSTAPLQHPRLVQALLACIFTPSHPPSPDLLTACADLLARATCTCTRHRSARQPDEGTDGEEEAAGGGGGGGEDEGEARAQRIGETRQALHWAVGLLSRPQGRFSEEDAAMAPQLQRLPVVAYGLLHSVTCQLGSPAFYDDAVAAAAAVPTLLRISLLVAEWQPHLIPRVLSSWSVALTELHRAALGELCRLMLDGCLALMRQQAAAGAAAGAGGSGSAEGSGGGGGAPQPVPGGAVREVLDLVEAWSKQGGADPALLRYFVLQVLGFASPPYSPEFCGALLRLLLAAGVRATNVRNEVAAALLREFAAAASEGLAAAAAAGVSPPLTAREQHLLAELAAAGTGAGPRAGG